MRRHARLRELAVAAAEATALTWRSAPGGVSGYLLVTLAESAAPIATAWLTKTVVDRLKASQGPVAGPAAALVAAGLAAAALPGIGRHLRAQTGRVAGVRATDRLFAATERRVGLRRFEDPVFLDRLRLAQEASGSTGYLVDSVCGVARGTLSLIGFVGGLDPEAEHEVHAQTRRHRAGRTSLLISHRLSAVRDADLIAVLDGGRVAELGETLMTAGGDYARSFRLQAAGYREAAG
ncbi:hypothetical protein [Actinoallomurus sp. NPDC052274]|uniref:hypothetical protein n=1 Tax=Actinoallomurus sp. NPDC052274 TaxID=3155420 RepID=UPI003445ED19